MTNYMAGIMVGVALVLWLLFMASVAKGATLERLSCEGGTGGGAATSFVLQKKGPGDATFVDVAESPTCVFENVEASDIGETRFRFVAVNPHGRAVRSWNNITFDPREVPPVPPTKMQVK